MRRDTAVFAVAGVLFGFVAGYMTANWRQPPSPTEAGAAGAGPSSSVPAAAAALDPNEERALVPLGRPVEAAAVWEDVLGRYPGDPQLKGLPAQIDSLGAAPAGVGP